MTIRTILHYPDPRLRHNTLPITTFDSSLQQLINDMFETMYDARGVGLASTQIGVDLQICVIDTSRDQSKQVVLINPEIITANNIETMQEGCLSVPGHYDTVHRATEVTFKALDRDGKPYQMDVTGVFAECVQHELDHLKGRLYIDQLSVFKQARIKDKMKKHSRHCKACDHEHH